MPSIFIWKSENTPVSKDSIRIYSGYNWMLEDNDVSSSSTSYKLYEQFDFNDNESAILVSNAKLMPTDWIGSELLEVSQVPYQLIKSDNYATYEIIGTWYRVILKNDIQLTKDNCESEMTKIKNWILK